MILATPFIAVLLSFFIVYTIKPKNAEFVSLGLVFSGAFLLAVIIFELLPEVYAAEDSKFVGLFISLGILFQILLEFFSKGAEHGHFHHHADKDKIPWLLWGSLSIHALIEGVPLTSISGLFYGIIVHKIIIALILSIFLFKSGVSFFKGLIFMGFFALMTPLGTYLIRYFDESPKVVLAINALVIGLLFHIATVILFESSDGHRFNIKKVLIICTGITLAYIFV